MTPRRAHRLAGCEYYSKKCVANLPRWNFVTPPRWRLSQLVDCVNAAVLPRTRLSEPMKHRRAQELRRKTRLSGRSGQGDACEEHAQGNGETTVRVMRHQAQTRQGGGIPPTKHRDANGGCSAREESSFSPKRATSMRRLDPAPEGAMRGHGRGLAERNPRKRDE